MKIKESALENLLAFMVQKMEDANLCAKRNDADALRDAQSAVSGATEALTALGIRVRWAKSVPEDRYTYVEVGGKPRDVKTFEDE